MKDHLGCLNNTRILNRTDEARSIFHILIQGHRFPVVVYRNSSSASLPVVVFGCGHKNYGKPQQGTGVLRLVYGKYSLLHRFGSRFSYF
ncbi:hypothetical protein Bca4012_054305 [Brassica carinata]